jgi:hypothetical protein
MVEGFLVQLLGRLEIQAMSFLDSGPVECHIARKAEGKELIDMVPERLVSVNQAQVYLDLIMRLVTYFITSLNYFKFSYTQYKMSLKSSETMSWIDSKAAAQAVVDPLNLSKHHAERDALNGEATRWLKAFKPLFSECAANPGSDLVSALAMFLRRRALCLSVQT